MPPRPNNHSSYGEEPAAAKSEASAPRGVLSGPKTYPVTPLLEAGAAQPAEPWLPPKRAFSTPQPGEAARGLLGDNFLDRPLLQRLDWIHVPLLLGTPVIALAGISQWAFDWRTLAFAVVYYFFSGLGITAGACGARAAAASGALAVEGVGEWGTRAPLRRPLPACLLPLKPLSTAALPTHPSPPAHPPSSQTRTAQSHYRLPPLLCAQGVQGHAPV